MRVAGVNVVVVGRKQEECAWNYIAAGLTP